jgi:hypothetical protein
MIIPSTMPESLNPGVVGAAAAAFRLTPPTDNAEE